jgi:hypothetical protein
MNDSDELLPTMMRRATERLDQPDAAALVERGLRRGRQLRRRRTVGISLAAASAVVLAATGAYAVGKFLPSQDVQVATSPSATPTPKQDPKPSSSPTDWSKPTVPPEPDPETHNPNEEEILAILRSVVPKDFKVSQPKTWGDDVYAGARVTVNDGDGATELSVFVTRASEPGLRCPVEPPSECQRFPDGSVVETLKDAREYVEGHPSDLGVIHNSATYERTDRLQVNLVSYNARAEKGQEPTRKRPPFSVEQLTDLAKDPRWQLTPPADGSMLPQR